MSFLDQLRSERESAATAFHQFVFGLPHTWPAVHAFYEGMSDQSFYSGFIRSGLSGAGQLHGYVCGGRDEVLDVHRRVHDHPRPPSEANALVSLFFIDRDFSGLCDVPPLDAADVLVTDYHSIENYLVSEEMLQITWTEVLHCVDNTEAYRLIRQRFSEVLSSFYEHCHFLSAWIVFLDKHGGKANLPNLDLRRLFRVNEDLALDVVASSALLEVERMGNAKTPPGFEEFVRIFRERTDGLDPKMWIRGKHELWVFVEFVTRLRTCIQDRDPSTGKRLRIRTPINHQNAMEVLGPRARQPESLRRYLREWIPARLQSG